jgi:PAS domain S-box-containing protein
MTERDNQFANMTDTLRIAAERSLIQTRGEQSADAILHELEVHQIEFEMQNETLQQSTALLEEMRDRYIDLYELAPVGYLTLTRDGKIVEINLTGAAMLAGERNTLLNRHFADFIQQIDSDKWHQYFSSALRFETHQHCELTLQPDKTTTLYVKLSSIRIDDTLDVDPVAACKVNIVLTDITEIYTVKKQLREKERLLGGIIEHMPNVIFVKRASDLRYELINRAGEGLFGYPRDEIIGKKDDDFFPSEQADFFKAEDRRALVSTNYTEIPEEIITNRSGESHYLHTWKVALHDENGIAEHLLGISVDITDRKLAELQSNALTQRIELFMQNTSEGVHVMDELGRIIEANDAFCRHLGYTQEEIKQLSLFDFVTQWTPDEVREIFRIHTGSTVFEDQHRRKDGCLVDVEVNVTFVEMAGKKCVFALSRDISERKQAQKELLEVQERNLSALFLIINQGYMHCQIVLVKDEKPDFIYLNVNEKFSRITGLRNVIGKKLSDVLPEIYKTDPDFCEPYAKVTLTGQSEKFEVYRQVFGLWLSVTVYSPCKGQFVALFDDITDRKRIEQELIVANQQLSHEVEKRTSELAALTAHIQKIAEAERASLARELHDELGSTLTALKMGMDRLSRKITDPEMLQDISDIKVMVANATQIMRDVIDQLYPTLLDNYGFVAALHWLVDTYRKHTGYVVELFIPEEQFDMETPYELAAYRITQECLNNIAKHAQASVVHICAKIKDDILDLTIQDNGRGMPIDKSSGGHGIFGMQERARFLGGTLKVWNEAGGGVSTHLSLPLKAEPPKKRWRVLIADDHAILRNALKALLHMTEEFSVEGEAADGQLAVQMALDGTWNIMLLDISLPKKNGIQVLDELIKAKVSFPVIILSSYLTSEYGKIALAKGAAAYIEKGATDQLINEMRRVIQQDK